MSNIEGVGFSELGTHRQQLSDREKEFVAAQELAAKIRGENVDEDFHKAAVELAKMDTLRRNEMYNFRIF